MNDRSYTPEKRDKLHINFVNTMHQTTYENIPYSTLSIPLWETNPGYISQSAANYVIVPL